MCQSPLTHLDQLDTMIARLDEQVEQMMQPFCAQRELIESVPGIAGHGSAAVISEIGGIRRPGFPLPSIWPPGSGCAPATTNRPANDITGGDKGNQHLQPVLVECAWPRCAPTVSCVSSTVARSASSAGSAAPRRGEKAIIAVAHKLIVILWHVLATGRPYQDLGADYFTNRVDPDKERRRLAPRLEAHGFKVTLEPAA